MTRARAWLAVWAVYRFHYAPTPDPAIRLDIPGILEETSSVETASSNRYADPRDWKPGLFLRLLLAAEKCHMVPHAWTYGLLFTHAASYYHPTFLLDERRGRGWAWYFPLAMSFKTPTATIRHVR